MIHNELFSSVELCRRLAVCVLLAVGLLALPAVAQDGPAVGLVPAADTDAPTLTVRDAHTGLAVAAVTADAFVREGAASRVEAEAPGRLALAAGTTRAVLSAPGYESLTWRPWTGEVDDPAARVVWMAPRTLPEELRPETLEALRLPNATLLHGRVVDPATGKPVENATVRLADGAETTTDAVGYFRLYAQGTPVRTETDLPGFGQLVVEAPGYDPTRLTHIALLEDDLHFVVDLHAVVDLRRGAAERVIDHSHKMFPRGESIFDAGLAEIQRVADTAAELATPAPPFAVGTELVGEAPGGAIENITAALSRGGKQLVNPPDTISVSGYGSVPLEVYVSRGLCAEWISSWDQDSINSGAVAYRSYAVNYVYNYGTICTSTSCQVYNNTYVGKCGTAAVETAGILLEKGGAVARSEYSAENNSLYCSGWSCVNYDRSCGSGYAGSPAYGWPCLSDGHSFGRGPGACCFGHGRGMCQWGTQSWAADYGWVWNRLVDHYYNDSGTGSGNRTMDMTSPLELVSVSPSSPSVSRGGTFSVTATVRNYADYAHGNLILGMSIYGPQGISDPANDQAFTSCVRGGYGVSSCDGTTSRNFRVPSSAPSGTYSMILAIWKDTNGNGQIDGGANGDEVLRTITYPNSVTVF